MDGELCKELARLRELVKPGQELYHSQCIDIMCDVWNALNKILGETPRND